MDTSFDNEKLNILKVWLKKYANLTYSIEELKNLEELNLNSRDLTDLPEELDQLRNLESLTLNDNDFNHFSFEITQLYNLRYLELIGGNSSISTLPKYIEDLVNLETLDLFAINLEKLPPQIGKLSKLRMLNLGANLLKKIPPQIGNLKNLEVLDLILNDLVDLPNEIGELKHLKLLNLEDNIMKKFKLPEEIGNIKNLQIDDDKLHQVYLHQVYLQHKKKNKEKGYTSAVKQLEKGYLLKKHPLTEGQYIRRLRQKENWATEWQEMCRHLGKDYKLDELKQIASSLHLISEDIKIKSKREVCALLAKDYDAHQKRSLPQIKKRNCHNPETLFGDDYDTIQDIELIEFEENGKKYCFTLEELDGIKTNKKNPYTK